MGVPGLIAWLETSGGVDLLEAIHIEGTHVVIDGLSWGYALLAMVCAPSAESGCASPSAPGVATLWGGPMSSLVRAGVACLRTIIRVLRALQVTVVLDGAPPEYKSQITAARSAAGCASVALLEQWLAARGGPGRPAAPRGNRLRRPPLLDAALASAALAARAAGLPVSLQRAHGEADDVMLAIVQESAASAPCVLVSRDSDLLVGCNAPMVPAANLLDAVQGRAQHVLGWKRSRVAQVLRLPASSLPVVASWVGNDAGMPDPSLHARLSRAVRAWRSFSSNKASKMAGPGCAPSSSRAVLELVITVVRVAQAKLALSAAHPLLIDAAIVAQLFAPAGKVSRKRKRKLSTGPADAAAAEGDAEDDSLAVRHTSSGEQLQSSTREVLAWLLGTRSDVPTGVPAACVASAEVRALAGCCASCTPPAIQSAADLLHLVHLCRGAYELHRAPMMDHVLHARQYGYPRMLDGARGLPPCIGAVPLPGATPEVGTPFLLACAMGTASAWDWRALAVSMDGLSPPALPDVTPGGLLAGLLTHIALRQTWNGTAWELRDMLDTTMTTDAASIIPSSARDACIAAVAVMSVLLSASTESPAVGTDIEQLVPMELCAVLQPVATARAITCLQFGMLHASVAGASTVAAAAHWNSIQIAQRLQHIASAVQRSDGVGVTQIVSVSGVPSELEHLLRWAVSPACMLK